LRISRSGHPSVAEIRKSPVHKRGINYIVFSKEKTDGPRRHDIASRFLITCSRDRTFILLGVPDLSRVQSYCRAIAGLLTCNTSLYNDRIITAGIDTIFYLWG
jgi:hypothetical protein